MDSFESLPGDISLCGGFREGILPTFNYVLERTLEEGFSHM